MKGALLLFLILLNVCAADLPTEIEYKNGKKFGITSYEKWSSDRVVVKYDTGRSGTVFFHHLIPSQADYLKQVAKEFSSMQESARRQRNEAEGARLNAEYEEEKAEKKRQKQFKRNISEGAIARGMSDSQVRESWGAPIKINASAGGYGRHEQWVYSKHYVYFENGIMTSWQRK